MVDPLAPSLTDGAAIDRVRDAAARALGRIAARRSPVAVSWSPAALEDLSAIASDPARQRALVDGIAEISRDPVAADEGGITDRLHRHRVPLRGRDGVAPDAGDHEHAGDLVVVYRGRGPEHGRPEQHGYEIVNVVAEGAAGHDSGSR